MRKRTRYSLLLMLGLVIALAVTLWLHKAAPPAVARILPESDAIVYANIGPIRSLTHFDRTPIAHADEYQQFIDATGLVAERDIDAVAFAIHRMDDPNGPNGPLAYSEVFEGRFDGAKIAKYLQSLTTDREEYAGRTIYAIPINGRKLRIAQLGYDTIAASNMPTTEQIHTMLDRYHAAASPFAGSSLLEARYHDVPLLSSAWGIGHIGLPFSEHGKITAFGLELPLPEDSTIVASLRFGVGGLHLRVEQIAPSEAEAASSTEQLTAIMHLFLAMQPGHAGLAETPNEVALRHFTESIKIEQHKDRAVLTGSVPLDMLKQLTVAPTP